MSQNEKILQKIRNLLSLAEDGGNDEESQTALLMAQKLMLKYKISQNELSETGENKIVTKSLSVYKRIYWWEKILVRIIAKNFRVMFYVQSSQFAHKKKVQRKLVYMGYPEDVELAIELFHLAAQSMKHYAAEHIKELDIDRQQALEIRRSYYTGFMDGLKSKFKAQREALLKEDEKYALVIHTPQEVIDEFNKEITGSLKFRPKQSRSDMAAYQNGYQKGNHLEINKGFLANKPASQD